MKKQSVIVLFCAAAVSCFLTGLVAHAATPKQLSAFPEGERLVYTRLVEAFRRAQLDEVVKQRIVLERNYPKSIHLDNAYYLSGMLEFQNNRLGEALKDFDVVRDRYTKSNKRPSALFATAITYQRLNLAPQAQRVFQRVVTEYPGSPESQRAWMHLQIAKQKIRPSVQR